jgi:hypothetical protein
LRKNLGTRQDMQEALTENLLSLTKLSSRMNFE